MLSTPPVYVADFPVTETTHANLVETIKSRMAAAKRTILFYANTNFIVKCRPLLSKMQNDDVIIVNGGVGMDIAAKLLYRRKFMANLNGTDFTPYFFYANAITPLRVFLLGGKADVLDKAAYYLVHDLKQIVVGSCDGYEDIKRPELVQMINEAKPDVLLVAMGNPRQEQWILDNYQQLDVKFITGVGALFDFWAGDKPRAPAWVQELRMEWLYRLCIEPRRLIKRYTLDILVFLTHCFRYRKKPVKAVSL